MGRRRDEPVRLTRIYTRGGDRGETSLGDGSRVPKTDARVVAYGVVDELNSHLGLVLAGEVPPRVREPLERIQNELFDLGADLAVPFVEGDDKLRYSGTNFIPGAGVRKGLAIQDWTPRFGLSGPLRKGRAWFSDSADVQYIKRLIEELPAGRDR